MLAVDPESLYAVGDLQKFCFGLGIRCGVWRDKYDLFCAQDGGVEPSVPGIKVHEYDGVFHVFAVISFKFAVAAVDEARSHATRWQCGGFYEVGP